MALSKEEKKALDKWEGLDRISQTTSYIVYLKPILQEAFNNKWFDPTQSTNQEEFHKQYVEAYQRAMAYKEIFNLLEGAGKRAEQIAKDLKNKKDYGLS